MLFLVGVVVTLVLFYLLRHKILNILIDFTLTEHRWIVIVPIVLPLALVYDFIHYTRRKFNFYFRSAPKLHDARVKALQEQLKNRDSSKEMCTARPSWQSTNIFHANYKKTHFKVDLSRFSDVLSVDTEKRTVRCEPMVTCGQLTSILAPLGWTTAVIPELDDLTVGGLICGFGVEGSSFKYGLFQHICVSYDVVLADGTLVTCSKDQNAELYYNIPWSYGTLGFLVAVDIEIIPLKKFIKLTYEPCHSKKDYIDLMEKHCRENKVDFIETLAYSEDEAVVMTGVMADTYESDRYNAIGRFWKPWFFEHVREFLKTGNSYEYIPSPDYFHRHTKSIFWEMKEIVPFGNHPVFRYLLGWMASPKVSFLKLTTTERLFKVYEEKHVDQDMLVPYSKLGETLSVFHKEWEMYPLWLCPCRIPKTPIRGLVNPDFNDDDLYIDVGAYGVPEAVHRKDYNPHTNLKKVEEYVLSVKGVQALYALTLLERDDFEKMFDHTVYRKLRKQYKCEGSYPEIYDKVSRYTRNIGKK